MAERYRLLGVGDPALSRREGSAPPNIASARFHD
jgi:hypothetical protein